MQHESPIEEIWRIRERLGAEDGYDVHLMFERLRREQEKYADRLVQVAPRPGREADSTCKPIIAKSGPA